MNPATGPCYNCRAPNSLYYPAHDHYACPKHARDFALWEESKQHFLDLIAPNVRAWYAHWRGRGLDERNLDATFEVLEPCLLEIVRPEAEVAMSGEDRLT